MDIENVKRHIELGLPLILEFVTSNLNWSLTFVKEHQQYIQKSEKDNIEIDDLDEMVNIIVEYRKLHEPQNDYSVTMKYGF